MTLIDLDERLDLIRRDRWIAFDRATCGYPEIEGRVTEGMVFSIQPGIYLPSGFGLQLAGIAVPRADGSEILSGLPRDLTVIG